LLLIQSWTTDLPADRFGEWHWRVSVVANGTAVATSSEWMFWFQPFGNGGNGGGDQKPTYTPPP
jgi:hypothetical protein